jgi:antitoxin component of MazEF toxin-antitoxin module
MAKEFTASVIESGNSLCVVVPAPFINKLGIRAKDKVKVKQDPQKGKVTYTFTNIRQLPLV